MKILAYISLGMFIISILFYLTCSLLAYLKTKKIKKVLKELDSQYGVSND